MRKYLYLAFLVLPFLLTSCKKHESGVTIEQLKDSVLFYAQEDYLWWDGLPTYDAFNPRGFSGSSDLAALQNEINAISQYKINPATGLAYENYPLHSGVAKYSFIDAGQTAATLGGSNSDFGFLPAYGTSSTDLRIRYVNPGSPAAKAGLHRGDLIISIVNVPSIDANVTNALNNINAQLASSSISMMLRRNNGTTYSVTINAAGYTANPVMKDTVFTTSNSRKVGYIVFSTFTSPDNAKARLDTTFSHFIKQGITDLVVDLRYNGGGYVSTAEYLDNLIVPAAKSGTKMYTSFYNTKLQADNYPLLANIFSISPGDFSQAKNTVNFKKTNTLNLSQVTFIVTGRTASASELTINNLRPHLDVRLIGTTTYGKPVGFFSIPIGTYNMYLVEFEAKNSAGQGGYYSGMMPGSVDYPGFSATDDLSKDFGDPTEGLLAHALSYVSVGTYALPAQQVNSTSSSINTISAEQQQKFNSKVIDNTFNGMIFDSKLRRKR